MRASEEPVPHHRSEGWQPGGSPSGPTPTPTPRGYRLLDPLGRGGHGTVWRARQEAGAGRVVALKRVRGNPSAVRQEAETLAALDHPHVVRILECVADGDGVAIAMQYAAGGSLADRLRRGPLEVREAAALLAPVGDALASAHRRGVLHRDVKPSNILLTADGHPLLSDFGIAGAAGGRGTPGYQSPLVRRGAGPTASCDVYALAVTFHVAVTGQSPDTDCPDAERRLDTLAPATLRAALERALRPDAAEPFSAEELASALRAAAGEAGGASLSQAPVLARRGAPANGAVGDGRGRWPQHVRPARRRRRWPWVAAALPLTLAALGTLVMWPDPGPGAQEGDPAPRDGDSLPADDDALSSGLVLPGPRGAASGGQAGADGVSPRASGDATTRAQTPSGGSDGQQPTASVAGDATGDGRDDTIAVARTRSAANHGEGEGTRVEVRPGIGGQTRRYRLSGPGGQVLIGDWSCDGVVTPALYDPASGRIFTFDGWPAAGAAMDAAEVSIGTARHGRALVRSDGGCDHVEVVPVDGP